MANDGTVKIGTELDDSGFKSGLSKLGSVASSALKGAASVIGGVATAASGAVAGLLALESATEEYRIAQGKLNTAFEAAGYGPETASEAYTRFYEILGDTDTATEASQLLAKLAQSEEDVATWADIAAGVSGTFGDALPIEGLIEASNETAKVGQVTGVLADALNWAGISEDEFNAKLAECTDESERNQLIMDTLSGTYDEATDAFYRNNDALVESRNAQAKMDDALAELGGAVSDVKTRMMSEFLPAISEVTSGLAGMLSGTEGAEEQFSQGISDLITSALELLPQFLDFGVQIISSLLSGIIENIPLIIEAIPQVVSSIVTALSELLPQIIEAGALILQSLGNGIVQAIPNMISMLPDVILSFVDFVSESLPDIIESGGEMLDSLTDGILEQLPALAEKIPQIITEFLNVITQNLPKILQKGVEITNKLVSGILEAIPDFVAKLPEIITSFVDFITENLPTIIDSGIDILLNLIEGIIKSIPELVKALPQIIEAIVNGIGDLLGSVVDVGKNIVEGIWEGISSMASWIWDKVSGFFSGIVDGAKSLLGIASPSKVFASIGGYMAEGVGVGWEDEFDKIKSDIDKSLEFKAAVRSSIPIVRNATNSMVPRSVSSANYSVQQQAIASNFGNSSLIAELRSIKTAIEEGKVMMVDRQVLGRITSTAIRNNSRALGVETY